MKTIPYARAGGPPSDWKDYEVYLDSVSVAHCVEANAEEGWVVVLDQFMGQPVIDMATEKLKTTKKSGKVLILMREPVANRLPL